MLLIAHLSFAFASLASMGAALVLKWLGGNKHAHLVKFSSVSFAGLLATGTALMIVFHSPILSTCLTGLVYLAGLAAMYIVYLKLPAKEQE